jgi:glycosyltransferase involved in cell wall biosynthesis
MSKYNLSVGAIFKNESHSIKEWIMHYLHHGVEHFYLINDNSTDNFMEILQEYIDKDIVTLFNVDEPYYLGRQRNLYNRHILPLLKESKWLLMVDLDEYVWSKLDINL